MIFTSVTFSQETETANLGYLKYINLKIKNVLSAKFMKSYKITSQVVNYLNISIQA